MWFEDDMEENNAQPKVGNPPTHDEQLKVDKRPHFDGQENLEHATQAPVSAQRINSNVVENVENKSVYVDERLSPNFPTVSKLKDKFGKGEIPQEADFKHLIEMAEVGCTAIGLTPGLSTPAQPGAGLSLIDGKLHATVIPVGTIVMFSPPADNKGKIPDGWALCDGSKGTPDLRNRFIMGGELVDSKKGSQSVFSGTPTERFFTAATDMATVDSWARAQPHSLTLEQIPSHQHNGQIRYEEGNLGASSFAFDRIADPSKRLGVIDPTIHEELWGHYDVERTTKVGGRADGYAEEHSHEIYVEIKEHQHTIKIAPPYIILAFIMKT